MLAVGKLQFRRILVKIGAEQLAEESAPGDESIPVVHEMETVGPRLFIERQGGFQLGKECWFAVECRVPNVDFVADLVPMC